jgi:hypothetical protein
MEGSWFFFLTLIDLHLMREWWMGWGDDSMLHYGIAFEMSFNSLEN